MYGINYQLIMYMLVMLIFMFKNRIDKYLEKVVLNCCHLRLSLDGILGRCQYRYAALSLRMS